MLVSKGKQKKILFRWGDAVALIVCAALFVFSLFFAGRGGSSASLCVECGGEEYRYPLDKDGVYTVHGLLGDSVIKVENGEAHFIESPCRNKNCVFAGKISRTGEWAACLPNDVLIRIDGENDEVDALSF
ncbi:MAG TPA: hypothetical protein DEO40_03415 [Treponema sp.]|jgi:hypothetical protein|nr:hypothetical protein [Treponema sp.]HBB43037.1 hypothetical protein [Treponema sp.]HCA19708.1 hypothetical protein [Treponema sp.]